MFNKRTGIRLLLVLLATVLIAVILGRYVINPQVDASPELIQFTVQAIIDDGTPGYRSTDVVIIAYVATTNIYSTAQLSALQVWRYQQGQLVTTDTTSFFKALQGNRSDWPFQTFYFSFESVTVDEAIVDVRNLYNMGLMPNSRGGNAQKWTLEKHANIWRVRTKQPYAFWD